ncbi:hypothetical protein ES707_08924 [subsurface metagenome]
MVYLGDKNAHYNNSKPGYLYHPDSFIPLVIVILSFFSGVEKPNRWLISGIIVGFCGVVVMNLQYGGLTMNNGILLVFLSCFCWGIYAVYGEKYMRLYPPMVTTAEKR